MRVQRKGETFEIERKVSVSDFERTREKIKITEPEFARFKQLAIRSVLRDSYALSKSPDISVKIYHGDYTGLVRAEVEFESQAAADAYVPFPWFGREVTGTALTRDGELSKLTQEEFTSLLKD